MPSDLYAVKKNVHANKMADAISRNVTEIYGQRLKKSEIPENLVQIEYTLPLGRKTYVI